MGYKLLLQIINYQNNSEGFTENERKQIRDQYKLELLKRNSSTFFLDRFLDDL